MDLTFTHPLVIDKVEKKKVQEPKVPKNRNTNPDQRDKFASKGGRFFKLKEILPRGLENNTLRRMKEKEKKVKKKKIKTVSEYSKISSQLFSKTSRRLLGQKSFSQMEDNLKKANLDFTPGGYLSIILMTSFLSCFVAAFLFLFFLFFDFGATLPIITRAQDAINIRFFKVIWILFIIPIGTFLLMYIYPGMEKKSAEQRIDTELPFATIHMAAISGSMINPINIFKIISSTKEYPALEKELPR